MNELERYYDSLFVKVAGIHAWMMLLPIVVAIWQRRYLNNALKVFLYYCIASFLLARSEQIIIWATGEYYPFFKPILNRFEIKDTSFLQILFVLKNYIFLGWFYVLLVTKRIGTILKYLVVILSLASLLNYLFIEGYKVIGVFNPIAEGVFRIFVPAFFLWFLFNYAIHFPIKKNPYFWISFGLASSNLITLFQHLIGHAIHKDEFILFIKIGIARNFFEIIALILFAIGFWYSSYAKFAKPLDFITIK